MKFSEIYEHEKVKSILKRAAENNSVGHAYIFEGCRGIGKLSTALAFASLLLCENVKNADSCGECRNCQLLEAMTHPDVRIITNQLYDSSLKSENILTDTIRRMKEEIYQKPVLSDRKIYIVPNADSMNTSAQNSLLKILEEPPLYCTIILIAENSNMFLQTVLSRSSRIRFSPLGNDSVEKYLEKEIRDKDKAKLIASFTGGSIGEAKKIALEEDIAKLREDTLNAMSKILNSSYSYAFDFAKFLKINKKSYKIIFSEIISFFESLTKKAEFNSDSCGLSESKEALIKKFDKKLFKGDAFILLEITIKTLLDIEQNVNYSLASSMMALDYWEVIHDRSNRSKV